MPNLAAVKRPNRLAGPIAFIVLSVAGCSSDTSVLDGAAPTNIVVLDEEVAAVEISRYRAQHGLGPVIVDTHLVKAASLQAASNAQAGRLSHESAGTLEARMASAGFGKSYAAENLSAGSETFNQVLGRWKASPLHNQNMLIPQMKRIGIARVDAPETRYKRYWALVLAGD